MPSLKFDKLADGVGKSHDDWVDSQKYWQNDDREMSRAGQVLQMAEAQKKTKAQIRKHGKAPKETSQYKRGEGPNLDQSRDAWKRDLEIARSKGAKGAGIPTLRKQTAPEGRELDPRLHTEYTRRKKG